MGRSVPYRTIFAVFALTFAVTEHSVCGDDTATVVLSSPLRPVQPFAIDAQPSSASGLLSEWELETTTGSDAVVSATGDETPATFKRSLDWSGFVQLDSGWFNQSIANRQAVGDVADTTGIRRLRLRATGQVLPDTSYVVDLDFAASGHPSFRDVKFTLHEQELLQNIQIGYFPQPVGFEAMTSGRDLLLLERQLPFALVPFRQTGIGAYGVGEEDLAQWSVSGYRFPTNPFGVSQGESGGWGVATRGSISPIYQRDSGQLLHLGGSYSFVNPGTNEVRYAIEPSFFVTDPATNPTNSRVPVFVDTGSINTRGINLTGLEFAAQHGPLLLQAEAIGAFVDQIDGSSLAFPAASAKIAYVLTGESHPYNAELGVFDRIHPRNPSRLFDIFGGAWESVLGWAHLDLNNRNIQGGRMNAIVLGLNRYINDHVKFQFNVIRVHLDDPNTGASPATIAAFRIQAEF
jgi:phosphate-selective porin OprO/OprP